MRKFLEVRYMYSNCARVTYMYVTLAHHFRHHYHRSYKASQATGDFYVRCNMCAFITCVQLYVSQYFKQGKCRMFPVTTRRVCVFLKLVLVNLWL